MNRKKGKTSTPEEAHRVTIVVLSWNGKRWLGNCLSTAERSLPRGAEILVVDNRSSDDSVSMLGERFPEIEVIQNPYNLGFAAGNNVGIKMASGSEFVVLLNQDTIVHEGWLEGLLRVADANPDIGILSPLQLNYEGTGLDPVFEGQLEASTSYPGDKQKGEVREVYDVPGVIGAAMMIRTDLIRRIGSFDPIYFLYFEEKDLCRRATSAGYRIVVVPDSQIGHWHGKEHASESTVDVSGHFLRNRQIYLLKDPTQPFWKNAYVYLRYGLPKALVGADAPALGYTGFWRVLVAQLGVWSRIPTILKRWHNDRRRVLAVRRLLSQSFGRSS